MSVFPLLVLAMVWGQAMELEMEWEVEESRTPKCSLTGSGEGWCGSW